jgi:hypothetical protein
VFNLRGKETAKNCSPWKFPSDCLQVLAVKVLRHTKATSPTLSNVLISTPPIKEKFKTLKIHFIGFPSSTYLFTVGVEVVYFHLITLRRTPQSVGLLWTRDRPVAETST